MFVYFGGEYKAAARAACTKVVDCDRCGERYAYVCERTGRATQCDPYFLFSDWAKRSAEREAARLAQRRADRGTDPVPCPACGLVQPGMVRALRNELYRPLRVAGWVCAGAALVGATVGGLVILSGEGGPEGQALARRFALATLPALGAAAGCWAGRAVLAAGVDPNQRDEAGRIAAGRVRRVPVPAEESVGRVG